MKASESKSKPFLRVLEWIRYERRAYQTKKFDYATEAEKPVEYWEQQFDSYIQRLRVYPVGTLQHTQAALKLAATTVAYAEHQAERGPLPRPGVASGILVQWQW